MSTDAVLLRHGELSSADREAWRSAQSGDRALCSPYFSLSFFDAVAAVRRDTAVLRVGHDHGGVSFLPLQTGPFGHSRGLAGPLGDHHGVIGAPVDRDMLAAALRQAGLSVFDHHGALAGQPAFASGGADVDGSWVCDLSHGYENYSRSRKKLGGNTARNIFTAQRKLSEHGEMVFRFEDRRAHVLDQLLAWKSAQYLASGHFDMFSVSWTRALVARLLSEDLGEDGRGVLSSLELDGRLIAVHFGLMGDRAMHYWFPAYDPELSKLGPGNALLTCIMAELAGRGVTELHLGPGDYRYKAALGSWQFPVVQGCITAGGAFAAARRSAEAVERWAESLPLGPAAHWPGKAFRRIDMLAGFRAA